MRKTNLFAVRGCLRQLQCDLNARQTRSFTRASPSLKSRAQYKDSAAFRLTEAPNPAWNLGQGLSNNWSGAQQWKEDEKQGWKTFDIESMDNTDIYKVLTSAVTPRPVAFVSSLSTKGVPNLAPFSYFSMIAHNPPLLSIAFTLSKRRPKDTRENIKSTKEFVVNIISEPFVEAANACSVEAPAEIDEWIVSGLTQEPSLLVKPPRVRESAVSLECELFHFHDITPPKSEEVTNSLVLGLIKIAHIRNSVLTEGGVVDPTKLRAISRLGGSLYARIGEGFELPRPSWRKIQAEVEKKHNES